MNHKKLRRIYAEEKLQVRRRGGRKRALGTRRPMGVPDAANQRWSLDFVSDAFTDGRRFRILTVVDDFTRENVALIADTRKKYAYSVRRFIEYHGELPLAGLARKHLSDFAADFLRLPKSTRSDIGPLAFWDAVRAAERENLPRVIERTRDQNLTHLKTLMGFAVNEGDRDGPDPWTRYTPTVAKQKVSEKRKKKTYVFRCAAEHCNRVSISNRAIWFKASV